MKSREHVTNNGRAVFFAAMWEDLKSAAISHGWALGLHGSLVNDMDIMAMAWDEHASTPEAMIEQLCICFTESSEIMKKMRVTTDMPNNRVVYTLPIWADFYLDINIISSQFTRHSVVTQSEKVVKKCDCVSRKFCLEICDGKTAEAIWERIGSSGKYSDAIKAMQEYSLLERSKARDKAIQECIEIVEEIYKPLLIQNIPLSEAIKELENLKSRQ